MMTVSPMSAPWLHLAVQRSFETRTLPSGLHAVMTFAGCPIMASRPTVIGMRLVRWNQNAFSKISQTIALTTNKIPHGAGATRTASSTAAATVTIGVSVSVQPICGHSAFERLWVDPARRT
jgi:hypothetical protein